jgi:putative flavoprotein involved in K+ transport
MPVPVADSIDGFIRRRTVGDLAPQGLRPPAEGTFRTFRRDHAQPAIVDPDVVEGIRNGRIEIVAGVSAVDADGVQFSDGTRARPDAIVAATGFSTGLAPMVGHLGVLDDQGLPGSGAATGLYFLGYGKGAGVIGPGARRATGRVCRELAARRRYDRMA